MFEIQQTLVLFYCWIKVLKCLNQCFVLPDCSESPLVTSDARQNRQMMGIKGQIPALCGEFWIFPVETILLAEFFNPFCRLSCCHIQTGIFADVNPWLWIMQVIWINLVYNNLEKQKKGDYSRPLILVVILKAILELAWYISLGGWVIPVGFMTSNWSYFEFSHQIHIDSNCLSQ